MESATLATDRFTQLLDGLDWSVTAIRRESLGPGGRRLMSGTEMRFHYIRTGTAELVRDGHRDTVTVGDFVLLPTGTDHTVLAGSSGVEVLTGSLELELAPGLSMNAPLPALLVAAGFQCHEPMVGSLVEGMERESRLGRIGSASLTSKLASLVATAALRSWIEKGCGEVTGWLLALRDPFIGRALQAVHADPGSNWTLEALARLATSSRSTFAERFRATVGDSPAHYVALVRMQRSLELLQQGRSVADIATSLGYGSDAAFSRAFRRVNGVPPSKWRVLAAA